MFQLISDGGCDFTKEEANKFNVGIVPFYISFDQENHLKEGVDISKEEYFERLVQDKKLFPKTAQPNPQDYMDICIPYLKEGKDIVILTISSKLSGSYNSAMLAASMLSDEFDARKIIVIDSLNGSIAQGLILKEMIKMRDENYSLHETTKIAEEILKSTRVYFTLDSLEYLRRGGRVGPTTALVGGILGLRPILHLEEGQVSQLDNVRGKKRVLKLMEEAMVAVLDGEQENINLSIGHILSEEDAHTFKTNTEAALNMKITNPLTEIGVTIGTHAGPGALAFAYCRKYSTFNRKDVA